LKRTSTRAISKNVEFFTRITSLFPLKRSSMIPLSSPAHQNHQTKSQEHERQSGQTALEADHFVVDGENVFTPKPELMMLAGRAEVP
jgi:hypothetical protein